MATTTQETARTEAGWRAYWLACADASEARAAYAEAEARRAEVNPDSPVSNRIRFAAEWRADAAEARLLAEENRASAAEYGCPECGISGRRGDEPCPLCAPALSPSEATELLGAMGHEVHAEVSHG